MSHEVAIVGGGCAGLACAIRLKERNIPFKLFEARAELGGRVSSKVAGDLIIDKGFQVLLPHYKTAKKLLNYDELQLCYYPKGASIISEFGQQWYGHQLPKQFRCGKKLQPSCWDYLQLMIDVCCGYFTTKKASGATIDHFKGNYSKDFADLFLIPFFRGVFLDPNCEKSINQFQYYLHAFFRAGAAVPAKGMREIPLQLAKQLPSNSIECSALVSAVDKNKICINNTEYKFKHVVVATDLSTAHVLLNQPLPKTPWLSVYNYVFTKKNGTALNPLSLVARPSVISHMNIPTLISGKLAPRDTHMINVSSFQLCDPEVIHAELGALTNEHDWNFLETNVIQKALPKYQLGSKFDSDISLCGDWVSTLQSIEGALHSGYYTGLTI